MTSDEIEMVIKDADQAWHGPNGEPMMNPAMPTEVATFRASLEIAYQLALLNENLSCVIGNRIPQIRVMVEPGDWSIQTQEMIRR